MSVRAKFRVNEVTNYENGSSNVVLFPVVSGSPENKEFYRWTPSGKVELSTINSAAAAQFQPGQEFYVDFTPADPPAAADPPVPPEEAAPLSPAAESPAATQSPEEIAKLHDLAGNGG